MFCTRFLGGLDLFCSSCRLFLVRRVKYIYEYNDMACVIKSIGRCRRLGSFRFANTRRSSLTASHVLEAAAF